MRVANEKTHYFFICWTKKGRDNRFIATFFSKMVVFS